MTTEVLRNMLYAGSPTLAGLGYVVLDEVHYLADRFRGAVWEEVIIHLPEAVRLVALSATVSNAEEFGDWLAQVRGDTTVIVEEHRPVPLWQHVMVGAGSTTCSPRPAAADGSGRRDRAGAAGRNPELIRTRPAGRPGPSAAIARRGGRRPRTGRRAGPAAASRPAQVPASPAPAEVIARLDAAGLLPAITFIFSRAGLRRRGAAVPGRRPAADHAGGGRRDHRACVARAHRGHPRGGPAASSATTTGWPGCSAGIAAHHAGMLPTFKEVVEELFAAGLVRAVFATETLALGINMPARTVVIERLDKWNGETHADLTPGEYTQLTGRAGRRGIDVEGHAVVLWQPGHGPGRGGRPGRHPDLSAELELPAVLQHGGQPGRLGRAAARARRCSSRRSPSSRPTARWSGWPGRPAATRRRSRAREASCHLGDFAEYAALRRQLSAPRGRPVPAALRGPAGRRGCARLSSSGAATSSGYPAAGGRARRGPRPRPGHGRTAAARSS